jgi:hypothetical protein
MEYYSDENIVLRERSQTQKYISGKGAYVKFKIWQN